MLSPEGSSKSAGMLEKYKNFNKGTLVIASVTALVGAYFAPALIAPALTLAAMDLGQIVVIDRYQKWRSKKK